MAVYDPDTEELQSLCRCMSGFSDQFYKEATARWGIACWVAEKVPVDPGLVYFLAAGRDAAQHVVLSNRVVAFTSAI